MDETHVQDNEVGKETSHRAPPIKLANAAPSLCPNWHAARLFGISAAVAAAYANCSKYNHGRHGHHHLRHNPREGLEPSPPLAHGNFYEDSNVLAFSRWSGNEVLECPFRVSEYYSWIRATPDGLILQDRLQNPPAPALVECKCPYNAMYESPPVQYVMQQFIQMFVYRIPVNYLVVWHPSGAMRIWRTRWCDVYWQWLFMRLEYFWTMLRFDVESDAHTMGWNVQAAEEHMKAWLMCDGDVERSTVHRLRIAKTLECHPADIPPEVPIQRLRFDKVDCTANEFLRRATLGLGEVDWDST